MRLRPAHLVAAFAASLVVAPPAAAIDAPTLQRTLTREAQQAGAFSGAYARDLGSGQDLVAVRPDAPRIPASVEKLFITSAALLRYGPDAQPQTRVTTAATLDEDGRLDGDLDLVGGGDPTLSEAGLGELAGALHTAGVRRIAGDVVGDDSRFDRRRGGPRTNYLADRDMGGRLGALVLNRGFQTYPAAYAARRLRAHLRNSAITVLGTARAGAAPTGPVTDLAVLAGPAMRDLVRQVNVPSDNFVAEMLLKDLGAQFAGQGSTPAGAAVVRDTLDDFGVRPRIADGSGLSRANRTTPRQVVRLLERMESQEIAATWRQSLAVPGRTGTVRRRMRGTGAKRCRVKTGTIRGLSNLAGVCSTTGGETVAFAWLMNGVNPYGARRLQDRMTALVARYDAG